MENAQGKGEAKEAKKDEAEAVKTLPPTEGASRIVRNNTLWAAGVGVIPVPLVDFAGVTGIQLKMINELAKYYDVPFRQNLARSAVVALIGGAAAPIVGLGLLSSVLKAIPVVGSVLGALSGPATAGAITYAVGSVFTLHFGAGGSLHDFDPEKFRDYFKEQFEKGKQVVESHLKAKAEGKPEAKPDTKPAAASPAK